MNILRKVKSAPAEIGMSAMSYCITMLEKAEVPHRGFYYDKLAEAMNADSVVLGRAVLDEIEAIEGVELARLKQKEIEHYTLLCARTSREIYDSFEHPYAEQAAKLLDEMRAGTNKPLRGGREVWRSAS